MHAKTLVTAAVLAGQHYGLTQPEVSQLLNGIFFTLVQKSSVDEINQCFKDVDGATAEITRAIEDFKSKGIMDILDGIQQLGMVLVDIEKDTQDCTHMQDDIARIKEWAQIFKNPMKAFPVILGNIMSKWGEIIHNLDTFNQDIAAQKWYETGLYGGLVLVDILGPLPPVADVDEIAYTQW